MSNMVRFAVAAVLCIAGAIVLFNQNSYHAEVNHIRGVYLAVGILLVAAGVWQFSIINRNMNKS
jgi:hypothetical protein